MVGRVWSISWMPSFHIPVFSPALYMLYKIEKKIQLKNKIKIVTDEEWNRKKIEKNRIKLVRVDVKRIREWNPQGKLTKQDKFKKIFFKTTLNKKYL